jgi:hypothetical protein
LHRLIAPALPGAFRHSINSSARADSVSDISSPSAFAVLRLSLSSSAPPATQHRVAVPAQRDRRDHPRSDTHTAPGATLMVMVTLRGFASRSSPLERRATWLQFEAPPDTVELHTIINTIPGGREIAMKTPRHAGVEICLTCACNTHPCLIDRIMARTILSILELPFTWSELANAAKQNPLCVRTIIDVVPGRPPSCHQFPPITPQPRAE